MWCVCAAKLGESRAMLLLSTDITSSLFSTTTSVLANSNRFPFLVLVVGARFRKTSTAAATFPLLNLAAEEKEACDRSLQGGSSRNEVNSGSKRGITEKKKEEERKKLMSA